MGHCHRSLPLPLRLSPSVEAFQRLIALRRTVSNFAILTPSLALLDGECLRGGISQGMVCPVVSLALNHKGAISRVPEIARLRRLFDGRLGGKEACRSEAARKREKGVTVPAFVVATVGGMDNQVSSSLSSSPSCDSPPLEGGGSSTRTGSSRTSPPSTLAQLEDYTST